jgi:prepilin-type N-terminal cleavage/methylation domain-containing protein
MPVSLTGAGRSERRPMQAGVSLVELLIATVIAAVTLCGAWSWLWNAGVASSATVDRARAATAAAYAARCIADDLDAAVALQDPPSAYAPGRALQLSHLHPGAAPETVLIVWDPSRRVLWRKASGTYLADHVTSFTVTYFDEAGGALSLEDLVAPVWPTRVARVAVEIVVASGSKSARAWCDVSLGQR